MSLFYPDTSALIALFDEDDPLHDKAKEVVRDYKIGEVLIPFNVQMEWESRTMREHDRLIPCVVRHLDMIPDSDKEELTQGEFNSVVDRAANEVRTQMSGIDGRKLDRARVHLQDSVRKSFQDRRLTVHDLKQYILNITYVFFDRGIGVIQFFITNGYVPKNISPEVEKKAKNYIAQNKMDLETGDTMILGELIKNVLSDDQTYDFVLGDITFCKKGQRYVGQYDGIKSRINFVPIR